MAFHNEWTWYNIYFPNPDGALCRLGIDEAEWRRSTQRRSASWVEEGDLGKSVGLVKKRGLSTSTCLFGTPTYQERPKSQFNYELFYRMLLQREELVRRGLLPRELPHPYQSCMNRK